MIKNYASLTGPLLGFYYPLPFDDHDVCVCAMNTSRLASLWGGIYRSSDVDRLIQEFGGEKLPDRVAQLLDYDSHVVRMAETEGVGAMRHSKKAKAE